MKAATGLFLLFGFQFLSASSGLADLGLYSGSFDPPTQAHLAIIRDAARTPHLRKLYVLVNTDGSKNFKASVRERIGMLRAGLGDLIEQGQVEIVPIRQAEKNQFLYHVPSTPNETLYRFVGEDSFQLLPEQTSDPRDRWVVYRRPGEPQASSGSVSSSIEPEYRQIPDLSGISSTRVRQALAREEADESLLNPAVASFIREHDLYRSVPEAELAFRKNLHERAFANFLSRLRHAMPKLDVSDLSAPPFEPTQSTAGEREEFLRWVAKKKNIDPKALASVEGVGTSCDEELAAP